MTSELPHNEPLPQDFEDFFEHTMNGYVTASATGVIVRANRVFARWLRQSADELVGRKLSDVFSIAGKVYYETHLRPLLKMQGFFEEVALELTAKDGSRRPVIGSALERRDATGTTQFIRFSFIPASDRKKYEQDLRDARAQAVKGLSDEQETSALREQFIAVLGHDLRNPLASLDSAFRLLSKADLDDRSRNIIELGKASISRMAGIIDNVMDFARGRLGGGIPLQLRHSRIEAMILQVVDELRIANPARTIVTDVELPDPVFCDPGRLGQVASNLLGNALVHGDNASIVRLHASQSEDGFQLWVANHGTPIPADILSSLFEPFRREDAKASQQGLGLGLYISSEIVKEHGGVLSVSSDETETRFTVRLPAATTKS